MPKRPRRIVFLAIPSITAFDIVGPAEIFTQANVVAGGSTLPYAIELVSAGPSKKLLSTSGYGLLADRTYKDLRGAIDTLLVAGGPGVEGARHPEVARWLRRLYPRLRRAGSVCTGAFVLAESGILDGRQITTHWRMAGNLAAQYPRIQVDPKPLWVKDGNIYTSAGITAGMDLALALVEEDLGSAVALAVAQHMVMFPRRMGGQAQFSKTLFERSSERRPLQQLTRWVAENMRETITVETMAKRCAMSPRNFARVFVREFGLGPAEYVEQLRVKAARCLLEQTAEGVERIAESVGFTNAQIMRRAFLRTIEIGPGEYRRRFGTMLGAGKAAGINR